MTREEHITRAMLLGMVYMEHMHCYRRASPTTMRPSDYFDADTLEHLTGTDVLIRVDASFKVGEEFGVEDANYFILETIDLIMDGKK